MNGLILCNGAPPRRSLLKKSRRACDLFIAADGGANIALEYNMAPDLVIGDLDSYEPRQDADFEVIHDTGQESNDLEKALLLALEKGIKRAVVLGATGKRLDHSLKNLSVLKQFNTRFEELLFRDNFGDTLLLPPRYQARLEVGTPVSLFPLSGIVRGILTHGLKYPLRNEALINGQRDGSSNEAVEPEIHITHTEGDLILFIAR